MSDAREPYVSQARPADNHPVEETEKGFGTGLRAQLDRKAPPRKRAAAQAAEPAPAKPQKTDMPEKAEPPRPAPEPQPGKQPVLEVDDELVRELARRLSLIHI